MYCAFQHLSTIYNFYILFHQKEIFRLFLFSFLFFYSNPTMGAQLSCNQFYCQQTHFQPEWLSTHLYQISSISNENPTQYSLEKGKLTLLPSPPLSLYLSKQLSFDSSMQQFLLPLHFQTYSQIPISFFIFLTPHSIPINSIHTSF